MWNSGQRESFCPGMLERPSASSSEPAPPEQEMMLGRQESSAGLSGATWLVCCVWLSVNDLVGAEHWRPVKLNQQSIELFFHSKSYLKNNSAAYAHSCTREHTHKHTCTSTHIQKHMHTQAHTHIHTHTRAHARAHARTHARTHARACACVVMTC